MPAWIRKHGQWVREDGADSGPPGSGALTALPVEVGFLTATQTFTDRLAALTALESGLADWFDLSPFTSCRITATVSASDEPVGAFVAVYYLDGSDVLHALDGVDGPKLALDPATVATFYQSVMKSSEFTLAAAARGDVRLVPVTVGGNATADVTFKRLALQLMATPLVDDGGEDPPGELVPVCEVFNIDISGYADVAAMLADGWVEVDPDGVGSFALVTTPTLTGKSLQLTITGMPGAFPYTFGFVKEFLGFTPNGTYYTPVSVYPESAGFAWRQSGPTSPLLPLNAWSQIGVYGAGGTANGDGDVVGGLFFTIHDGSYTTPAIANYDRFQIVTGACIDGNFETPDDTPPNTSLFLFVEDAET